MASTASTRLKLEKQATGENPTTWGTKLNTVIELVDDAIAGTSTHTDTGGAMSLTQTNYAADEARMMGHRFTGTLTSNLTCTIPSATKIYVISNETSGSYSVTFTTGSGNTVTVLQGTMCIIFCDGTNVYRASPPVSRSTDEVEISGLDAANISAGDVSNTEFDYLNGVTSAIQTQINALLPLAGGTVTGDVTLSGADILAADNKITRPQLEDYAETVNAIGSIGGGTQDIDLELGNVVTATVDTSTTTFTFSNPPASGKAGSFSLKLTNGGSQTVNWPASVNWAGGTAPTLTTSGYDWLTFFTVDGGTNWDGFVAGQDMS